MAGTRMEAKQRLHTRPQGLGTVDAVDGPIWTPDEVTWVAGRRSRPDFRGFPKFAGIGPEIDLEVA